MSVSSLFPDLSPLQDKFPYETLQCRERCHLVSSSPAALIPELSLTPSAIVQ